MSSNASVPPEVAEIFLRYALESINDDRSGLRVADLLCVNRQWLDIGLRVIWSHVVIVGCKSLASLVRTPPSSRGLELVKSLTFRSPPPKQERGEVIEYSRLSIQRGNHHCRALAADLLALATLLLPSMTRLETFVFHITTQNTTGQVNSIQISRYSLCALIEALPCSVQNLEIDTRCYDRLTGEEQPHHVCCAIAKRMPQLRHLRLRLAIVCPEIFQPSPKLETFSLSLLFPDQSQRTVPCGEEPKAKEYLPSRYSLGREARRALISGISAQLNQCPRIRQAIVVASYRNEDKKSLDCINVYDLLANKTTSYPVESAGYNWTPEKIQKYHVMLRHTAINGEPEDVVGLFGDIEELLEGQYCQWQTTVEGSRFPHSYRDSILGRKHEWRDYDDYGTQDTYPRKLREAGGGESLKDMYDKEIELWKAERQAGRRLAEVGVYEGLGDVEKRYRADRIPPEVPSVKQEHDEPLSAEDVYELYRVD